MSDQASSAPETEETPKPLKQTKTVKKILRHTHKLLWQRGFAGTSLNDLVAKAKISKGGFFHYFPNKKAVVTTVMEEYFTTHIVARFDKHLGQAGSAMEIKGGLFNWLEETYNLYNEKGFQEGCMLGNITLETADQDEELRELAKSHFIAWENQIVSIVKPLYQEGKMLMDPRQFARLFIATFEGITMTCKAHRDTNRASRDFQALGEFIERMIRD